MKVLDKVFFSIQWYCNLYQFYFLRINEFINMHDEILRWWVMVGSGGFTHDALSTTKKLGRVDLRMDR